MSASLFGNPIVHDEPAPEHSFSESMNELVCNLLQEQQHSSGKRSSVPSIVTSIEETYPALMTCGATTKSASHGPDLSLMSPTSASFFKAATEQIDTLTSAVPAGKARPSPLRYHQVFADQDGNMSAQTHFMSITPPLNTGVGPDGQQQPLLTLMSATAASMGHHTPASALTPSNANTSSGTGFPHLPYISPLMDASPGISQTRHHMKSLSNGDQSSMASESTLVTPVPSPATTFLTQGESRTSSTSVMEGVNPSLVPHPYGMQSIVASTVSPSSSFVHPSQPVPRRTSRSHSLSALSIFTPLIQQQQPLEHQSFPGLEIRTAMDFTPAWETQPSSQDPFAASAPVYQSEAAFPHLPHPSQPAQFAEAYAYPHRGSLPTLNEGSFTDSPLLAQHFVSRTSSLDQFDTDPSGDDSSTKKKRRGPRPKSNVRFICEAPGCGMEFPKYSLLKGHAETHNLGKPKPFQCEMCPQSFSRSHDLKRHYYVHTNNKPFSCDRCGKGFSRIDALKRHEKSVADGRKVHCVPVNRSRSMSASSSYEDIEMDNDGVTVEENMETEASIQDPSAELGFF